MNTIFIYTQEIPIPAKFFSLEGNYSHLDGVIVNTTEDDELTNELLEIMYPSEINPDGELRNMRETLHKFPNTLVKEDTEIVICSFPH